MKVSVDVRLDRNREDFPSNRASAFARAADSLAVSGNMSAKLASADNVLVVAIPPDCWHCPMPTTSQHHCLECAARRQIGFLNSIP